jgi:lipid-binding SYLF domain-containing protein
LRSRLRRNIGGDLEFGGGKFRRAKMSISRRQIAKTIPAIGLLSFAQVRPSFAASASQLVSQSNAALQTLYAAEPNSVMLSNQAKAILVFPDIVKAGFIVGAETGNGVLFEGGAPTGYYNISAGSYGLQAGVQSFSYALFFMTNSGLNYLVQSQGWSVGVGPSVVVLDHGKAASMTSTTLTQDVYALPFGEQGLMAGMGIQGSKISPISPGP